VKITLWFIHEGRMYIMKIFAILIPLLTTCLILTAYAPVIKLTFDLNREYRDNFNRLKSRDTEALEESIRKPLENFLPYNSDDLVKDTALELIREFILQRFTNWRVSQD
jgi:hypothetical protein